MEMYEKSNVFVPDNTTSTLQPMDQGVILTFMPYYIEDTFCKAITAIDSIVIPLMDQGNVDWKPVGTLDATKNIRDSWE